MNTTPDMSKENKRSNLLRATSSIGGWTMASRLLGFVRDLFIARLLGASLLADAFFVALKLPNFFRRLFGEGTLSVAIIPVLAEERQQGEAAAHRYLDAMAGLVLTALTLLTLLGILFMPALLLLFAPGFADEPNRWAATVSLARWMFPYLLMISLTAMAWAVLNGYKKFALAAATPILYNVAIVFGAVVLSPMIDNPAFALALGVLLGGLLQLLVQFPALRRLGWRPRPLLNLRAAWRNDGVRRTLPIFGGAVLGIAAVQINLLVGGMLATMLPEGAVSFLYYADRIMELPLALFGIAMGTAILPTLSDHLAKGDREAAQHDLSEGLSWLTWITLPALAGILWLAEPIIVTLFQHGAFTHRDAVESANALRGYGVGLIAFCWARVLAAACYAGKDARNPARFAAIGVAANIVLSLILMQWLAHVGLALATSLAAFVNAGLLFLHLRKSYGRILSRTALRRIRRAVAATLAMLLALAGFEQRLAFPNGILLQFLWLGADILLAFAIFVAVSRLLGEKINLRGLKGAA